MVVDSYLELITTIYGWMFYDRIWDVLKDTGIVYMPFAWKVVTNMMESHDSSTTRQGVGGSLRRMEIELITMMAVLSLAAVPTLALDSATLTYLPPVTVDNPNPVAQSIGGAGMSFGLISYTAPGGATLASGFTDANGATVNVPVWWAGIMAMSAGLNAAIKTGLPAAADLRGVSQLAALAAIKDPALREESQAFYNKCFVPARSMLQADNPNMAAAPYAGILATYGKTDTDWMGSHVFLATYYTTLRSPARHRGVDFDPNRDFELADLPVGPPDQRAPGSPYCSQWWTGIAAGVAGQTAAYVGLKAKIVAQAAGLDTQFGTFFSAAGGLTAEKRGDAVVQAVLSNSPPQVVSSEYAHDTNVSGSVLGAPGKIIEGAVRDTLGTYIVGVLGFTQKLVMSIMLKALPMVQALLLFGVYALLPFVMVIGLYSLEVVFAAMLGLFTIKFLAVLWAIANWIDSSLIVALYPDANSFLSWVKLNSSDWLLDGIEKRMILDLLTTGAYLGLPVLWTALMAWAGYNGMNLLSNASSTFVEGTSGADKVKLRPSPKKKEKTK